MIESIYRSIESVRLPKVIWQLKIIGESFVINFTEFDKKPNWFHRFFMKLFLGFTVVDL